MFFVFNFSSSVQRIIRAGFDEILLEDKYSMRLNTFLFSYFVSVL